MADKISIHVTGIDKLSANLDRLGDSIKKDLGTAGHEAATEILDTVGLRAYPPATEANRPPTPYYVRTIGMQRAGRRKPEYNDKSSQNLGKKFYVRSTQNGTVVNIGNPVTYAPYVVGDEQSAPMAAKGWRKLVDVANEKITQITEIYQGWIDRIIRINGL